MGARAPRPCAYAAGVLEQFGIDGTQRDTGAPRAGYSVRAAVSPASMQRADRACRARNRRRRGRLLRISNQCWPGGSPRAECTGSAK
ncbi:hypothetical protein WS68_03985 [Burkholderia sp. TSV86]|nr:hypothetical protein WS68_03985 [Burkholderia sp. TSV86]